MTTSSSHFTSGSASSQVSVTITEVWRVLGGGPLRHGRGRAFWRDGDGYNVAIDARKNVFFDHVAGAGGGVLDLVQAARCCDRSEAWAWLRLTFGLPDQRREFTPAPAERAAWARQRAKDERDLLAARWFARAATLLAEGVLETLEVANWEREYWTRLLVRLRSDTGALAEYRAGRRRKVTRALVAAGRAADAAAQQWCARLIMEGAGAETV